MLLLENKMTLVLMSSLNVIARKQDSFVVFIIRFDNYQSTSFAKLLNEVIFTILKFFYFYLESSSYTEMGKLKSVTKCLIGDTLFFIIEIMLFIQMLAYLVPRNNGECCRSKCHLFLFIVYSIIL